MMSITSTRYLSNVDWLQDVVQGTDLILCGVSALEYLELFNGYVNESKTQKLYPTNKKINHNTTKTKVKADSIKKMLSAFLLFI